MHVSRKVEILLRFHADEEMTSRRIEEDFVHDDVFGLFPDLNFYFDNAFFV